MNHELTQTSAQMYQSSGERVATAVIEATRAAVNAFRETWRKQAPRRANARAFRLMADMDAHTLRDIGAPEWLIAQAVERKDAPMLQLKQLNLS